MLLTRRGWNVQQNQICGGIRRKCMLRSTVGLRRGKGKLYPLSSQIGANIDSSVWSKQGYAVCRELGLLMQRGYARAVEGQCWRGEGLISRSWLQMTGVDEAMRV